ncbi:MAG: glycoside hydrolase family 3 N-terminal domain-containing protein, partial [Spirochaetota bacterium]
MVQTASLARRVVLAFTILTTLSGTGQLWSVPHFFQPTAARNSGITAQAERLVAAMSDTELLGQVFLLGYFGQTPSPQILDWIRDKHIGGVKIFGWNAENLQELGRSIGIMQSAATESGLRIPLFIATDQEGGWVRHIKGDTSITPGNLAIGATSLPYDAYYTGLYIGKELRSLGINMNFAPTVDIYSKENAHVIGPRAFAEDPLTTAP